MKKAKRAAKPNSQTAEAADGLESLVRAYGPVVYEIDILLKQYKGKPPIALPPYFRQALGLSWWPADFLSAVGLLAWEFPPFVDAVRLLHITAQLPRRGNESPVELPGRIGKGRLKETTSSISWERLTELPDRVQDVRLGKLMFPMFGNAGSDEDALHAVATTAREELERFLRVELSLIRQPKPYARVKYLATYREYERLHDLGLTWNLAIARIAESQGRTRSAVHGDIQRAMQDLGLNSRRLRKLRERRATAPAQSFGPCPDHGKPLDAFLTCVDCLKAAEAEIIR